MRTRTRQNSSERVSILVQGQSHCAKGQSVCQCQTIHLDRHAIQIEYVGLIIDRNYK